MSLLVLEPHSGHIVRHISVEVADAALCLVDRAVSHPGQTVLETVMVGVTCSDELVRAREVLHRTEILCDGSESAVEDTFLYSVSPLSVSCSHKVVAHSPGVVCHVTSLVACKRVIASKSLCAGVDSVDEHIRSLHLVISLESCLEVLLLAGVSIEDHRDLHQLVHSHTVHMEL